MGIEATTVLRGLASGSVLAGTGMLAMGLGVIDIDPTMGSVANVFLEPVGLPLNPFLAVLGSCKILGVLSLWNVGPMPKSLGMIGLAMSALCGAAGHYVVEGGAAAIPPIVYLGILGLLVFFESKKADQKIE
eukprot:CAMPEP_0202443890 /NCGR_PEP_ID=MMETSP1360-20130828/3064_1 /ASSEMBLY_ACC=CAM_ASM_000848 /TAXON_ID=515479 /ORGANISM="Licmophora paradoxa, Strain CCMP2313" /LENGTH=131 /DNA_ID=CAMNT_0049059721 /DNA_START=43 /DNA_END=438 /DNA_ORIENTATION=-